MDDPSRLWSDDRAAYAAIAGRVVRRMRELADLSQADLASRSSLSTSSLSRFEHGQSMPDLHELRRLAIAIGRDAAGLIAIVDRAFDRAGEIARRIVAGDRAPSAAEMSAVAAIAASEVCDASRRRAASK